MTFKLKKLPEIITYNLMFASPCPTRDANMHSPVNLSNTGPKGDAKSVTFFSIGAAGKICGIKKKKTT